MGRFHEPDPTLQLGQTPYLFYNWNLLAGCLLSTAARQGKKKIVFENYLRNAVVVREQLRPGLSKSYLELSTSNVSMLKVDRWINKRQNGCFKQGMEPQVEAGSSDLTDLITRRCHDAYVSPRYSPRNI